jgi:hypothetical protein
VTIHIELTNKKRFSFKDQCKIGKYFIIKFTDEIEHPGIFKAVRNSYKNDEFVLEDYNDRWIYSDDENMIESWEEVEFK